ncbi:hypothetical protein BN871_AF_00130 [Paenibacillus sp. P22]|nr:hypothetical protein BN871_AF_00130 [Paenibacillus sp. P22]
MVGRGEIREREHDHEDDRHDGEEQDADAGNDQKRLGELVVPDIGKGLDEAVRLAAGFDLGTHFVGVFNIEHIDEQEQSKQQEDNQTIDQQDGRVVSHDFLADVAFGFAKRPDSPDGMAELACKERYGCRFDGEQNESLDPLPVIELAEARAQQRQQGCHSSARRRLRLLCLYSRLIRHHAFSPSPKMKVHAFRAHGGARGGVNLSFVYFYLWPWPRLPPRRALAVACDELFDLLFRVVESGLRILVVIPYRREGGFHRRPHVVHFRNVRHRLGVLELLHEPAHVLVARNLRIGLSFLVRRNGTDLGVQQQLGFLVGCELGEQLGCIRVLAVGADVPGFDAGEGYGRLACDHRNRSYAQLVAEGFFVRAQFPRTVDVHRHVAAGEQAALDVRIHVAGFDRQDGFQALVDLHAFQGAVVVHAEIRLVGAVLAEQVAAGGGDERIVEVSIACFPHEGVFVFSRIVQLGSQGDDVVEAFWSFGNERFIIVQGIGFRSARVAVQNAVVAYALNGVFRVVRSRFRTELFVRQDHLSRHRAAEVVMREYDDIGADAGRTVRLEAGYLIRRSDFVDLDRNVVFRREFLGDLVGEWSLFFTFPYEKARSLFRLDGRSIGRVSACVSCSVGCRFVDSSRVAFRACIVAAIVAVAACGQ